MCSYDVIDVILDWLLSCVIQLKTGRGKERASMLPYVAIPDDRLMYPVVSFDTNIDWSITWAVIFIFYAKRRSQEHANIALVKVIQVISGPLTQC